MTQLILRPQAVWIGEPAAGEWSEAVARLERDAILRNYADVAAALASESALQTSRSEPAVILLAPTRRGQLAAADIAALRAIFPLAPIVQLVGSWLEGEPRTGRPLPGVIRLPWTAAWPRIAAEVERWSTGRRGGWSLPLTAGDDERTLALLPSRQTRRYGGWVAVVTDDLSLAEALLAACDALGATAVACRAEQSLLATEAALVVWDLPIYRSRAERQGEWLDQILVRTPKLAITGFPRPDDREFWQSRGVVAVLPKPFALPDLAWHFDQILNRQVVGEESFEATPFSTRRVAA